MRAILLVNTGSPSSAKPRDVRTFIETMLSDPLVMTVADWFRPLLVKGIIGPFRQFASARKYDLIWDAERDKSPQLFYAEELKAKLEAQTNLPVEIGMVYLNPSISDALDKLTDNISALEELIVLPLFPHYAESSYLAAVSAVEEQYKKKEYPFQLKFIEPYFDHPKYIEALCMSMESFLKEDYDRVIFNFHSLPLSHVEKGFEKGKEFDYVFQIKETVRLITDHFGLPDKKIRVSFSSAFGKKWLEPSLTNLVKNIAKSGAKKILVVSPGFAMDNLETLYDIDIDARKVFFDYGGEELVYIPCLNAEDYWVHAIQQIIQ